MTIAQTIQAPFGAAADYIATLSLDAQALKDFVITTFNRIPSVTLGTAEIELRQACAESRARSQLSNRTRSSP